MCEEWDPGSLFVPAGAEGCRVLTFAREGSEVKSNTNKVETLIVAFMDGTGLAPSEGEEGTERLLGESLHSREEKTGKIELL